MTSVEHDAQWFRELKGRLGPDVTLKLIEPDPVGNVLSDTAPGCFDKYVSSILNEADQSIDLVIVDGRARVACFRAALEKVKPGGAILLDDSDRPKYEAATTMVDWPRVVFRGLKPGVGMVCETSMWMRPTS
ncbi:MAG TPA: hypothetical protein VFX10_02185 [Nitrospira sp.]|nr:hypothetical protein [Nitrospira sp.]